MAGFKKPSLGTAVTYFFLFALCAKLVYFFASNHPPKEDLTRIQGVVQNVRLGGEGRAAYLMVTSNSGTHRYSSYYGTVWPGMANIQKGDTVDLLAEKNRLYQNALAAGKNYYIWELVHHGRTLIRYEDVQRLVQGKEERINTAIHIWIGMSLFLLVAIFGREFFKNKPHP